MNAKRRHRRRRRRERSRVRREQADIRAAIALKQLIAAFAQPSKFVLENRFNEALFPKLLFIQPT